MRFVEGLQPEEHHFRDANINNRGDFYIPQFSKLLLKYFYLFKIHNNGSFGFFMNVYITLKPFATRQLIML